MEEQGKPQIAQLQFSIEVTYILTNELTLYNYKWLLNNSLEHYGT